MMIYLYFTNTFRTFWYKHLKLQINLDWFLFYFLSFQVSDVYLLMAVLKWWQVTFKALLKTHHRHQIDQICSLTLDLTIWSDLTFKSPNKRLNWINILAFDVPLAIIILYVSFFACSLSKALQTKYIVGKKKKHKQKSHICVREDVRTILLFKQTNIFLNIIFYHTSHNSFIVHVVYMSSIVLDSLSIKKNTFKIQISPIWLYGGELLCVSCTRWCSSFHNVFFMQIWNRNQWNHLCVCNVWLVSLRQYFFFSKCVCVFVFLYNLFIKFVIKMKTFLGSKNQKKKTIHTIFWW